MSNARPTKEWYEEAAASENLCVRAVILKTDHVAHDQARELAENAVRMASRALGKKHEAYAVAVQNIGLYYDAIERDSPKAAQYFEKARSILADRKLPLAEGFHWLGVFFYGIQDAHRADRFFFEALEIRRQALGTHHLKVAESLVYLACSRGAIVGRDGAVSLLTEALAIQRDLLPPGDRTLADTAERLASLLRPQND